MECLNEILYNFNNIQNNINMKTISRLNKQIWGTASGCKPHEVTTTPTNLMLI